jgi:N-acetylneuraminate lyase
MAAYFALGQMDLCQELQQKSQRFFEIIDKYRGNIVGGKRIMKFLGLDCGPNRLPLQNLSGQEEKKIREELEAISFFENCNT